jgi:catechol 2,3-dioxygenase-like lactoylglutathione lyase family enzyme
LQQWHLVNVNVRDLDRSVAFYSALGFEEFTRFTIDDPRQAALHRVPNFRSLRAAMLRLPDRAPPYLDLVEYLEPPTKGEARPDLAHVGPGRIAFRTSDIVSTYQQLKEMNVRFLMELRNLGPSPASGRPLLALFFEDPDGTVIELNDWSITNEVAEALEIPMADWRLPLGDHPQPRR